MRRNFREMESQEDYETKISVSQHRIKGGRGGKYLQNQPSRFPFGLIIILMVLLFAIILCFMLIGNIGKQQNIEQELFESSEIKSEERQKFEQSLIVQNVEVNENENTSVVSAVVKIPDLDKKYLDLNDDIFAEKEIEDILLQSVTSAENSEITYHPVEIEIDLRLIDPEKNEWSESEIHDIVINSAIEQELENFAFSLLLELAPEYEVIEE